MILLINTPSIIKIYFGERAAYCNICNFEEIKIMEEKKFPIYLFWGSWNQLGYDNNSTAYTLMYKEDPTSEELLKELNNFKDGREEHQIEQKHPISTWIDAGYKFKEAETWCSGWFGHYTYNQFESEQEIFDSFEKFVDRKRNYVEDIDCLMGADDRWRWEICRCNGCKARGVIRINH